MPQVAAYNNVVNPYEEGNVRLDSTPVVAYYMRQQAQKRATDEALDKYYMGLMNSITPTGMRNQEVGQLLERQNADKEFYLQNRRAIKDPSIDGGKANSEWSRRHNEKLALIQQSKNELKGTNDLLSLRKNPQLYDRMDDDKFIGDMDVVNLPLGHPDRQFGANDMFSNLTLEAKRLTPAEQLARIKMYGNAAGKLDTKRTIVGIDPNDSLKDVVKYEAAYTPADLKKIGDVAAMDFQDPSVKRSFLHPSADQLSQLAEIGRDVYGKDWVPDTPEKVYQAASIAHFLSESATQKSETNLDRYNAAALARGEKLARARSAATQAEQQPIDLYYQLRDKLFAPKPGEKMFTLDGKGVGIPINLLSEEEQNYVVGQAKNNVKDPSLIGYDNILLVKKGDKMAIAKYKKDDPNYMKRLAQGKSIPDEEVIVYLSPRGTNVQANQPLGQKAKQEAANKAGQKPPKQQPSTADPLGILE